MGFVSRYKKNLNNAHEYPMALTSKAKIKNEMNYNNCTGITFTVQI